MLDRTEEFPGTPKFYRKKAHELLTKAEMAATEDDRLTYLTMAEHWRRLAQCVEEVQRQSIDQVQP
jgi:hypothetical protein